MTKSKPRWYAIQARINWDGCGRKGIRRKNGGLMEGDRWLVQMEWRPPGWSVCLPLVILPSTIKSRRSFLLALALPGGPGKKAVKRLWWWWWWCAWTSHQCCCLQCFDTVGWAAGRESDLQKRVVRYWRDYRSGVRCKWFAYGPADTTSSLAPVKSRMVYLSGTGLLRLSWKKGH